MLNATDQVNEMNDATRQQQAFHNHVTTKVKNHQPLEDNEIKHLAPVAFKSEMSPQEVSNLGLSNHYSFVPTMNVVKDLQTMGWDCVDAKQVNARKKINTRLSKTHDDIRTPKI
jgi:hypothetical protein